MTYWSKEINKFRTVPSSRLRTNGVSMNSLWLSEPFKGSDELWKTGEFRVETEVLAYSSIECSYDLVTTFLFIFLTTKKSQYEDSVIY